MWVTLQSELNYARATQNFPLTWLRNHYITVPKYAPELPECQLNAVKHVLAAGSTFWVVCYQLGTRLALKKCTKTVQTQSALQIRRFESSSCWQELSWMAVLSARSPISRRRCLAPVERSQPVLPSLPAADEEVSLWAPR